MNQRSDSCLEVENLLPLYVGADLDPSEMDVVAEHLNDCEVCRRDNIDLLEARERISRLSDARWVQQRPDVWPGIRDGLREAGLVDGAELPQLVPASGWQRLRVGALAAAAALLVSLGGLQLLGGDGGSKQPSSTTGPGPMLVQGGGESLTPRSPEPRPRGSIMPVTAVSSGSLPRGAEGFVAPPVLKQSRQPGKDGLRRATESDPHLIDSARPVGLGGFLPSEGTVQRVRRLGER